MNKWHEDSTGHQTRTVSLHQPPGVVEIVGGGTTCLVGLLDDGIVLKYPRVSGEWPRELDVEATIYEALGQHPSVIDFLGRSDYGLRLRQGTSLLKYLDTGIATSFDLRLKWVRQCAEGMKFLHSRGVIHCDFQPDNLLLDAEDNIRICDFQGIFENLDGAALEPIRYSLPRSEDSPPSTMTDIFALGSTLYKIMTGRDPWSEIKDEEVIHKFRIREFPSTDFVVGRQILKCWQQGYSCADEVFSDLAQICL